MSKEKTDDKIETPPETALEGQHHGLTPEQVAKIEAARGDKEPSPRPEPPPAPDYTTPGQTASVPPRDEEDVRVDKKHQ